MPFSNIYIAVTFTALIGPHEARTKVNGKKHLNDTAAIKRHGSHSQLVIEDNMTDCLKMKQYEDKFNKRRFVDVLTSSPPPHQV